MMNTKEPDTGAGNLFGIHRMEVSIRSWEDCSSADNRLEANKSDSKKAPDIVVDSPNSERSNLIDNSWLLKLILVQPKRAGQRPTQPVQYNSFS